MMVTFETLTQAGMNEDEAMRILEMYDTGLKEAAPETESRVTVEEETAMSESVSTPDSHETDESETHAEPEPAEPVESDPETIDPDETLPEETPFHIDYAAENAELRARLIESELRAAGMAAGVPPERLRTLARLADTSQVDVIGENAASQIADAVASALKEVPELAATPFAAGSLGTHPRESSRLTDPFAHGLMGQ